MLPSPEPPSSIAEAALDLGRLGAYLSGAPGGLGGLGALSATPLTGGRSNLTFLVTDGDVEFVVRRPPLGALPRRAYDVAREFRMMSALRRQDVRVPALRHLCEDAQVIGAAFLVMDRVHGTVLRDVGQVVGLSAEHCGALCDQLIGALVELHRVDAVTVVPDAPARGAGFTARQVARWAAEWQRWRTHDLPVVGELGRRLAAGVPPAGPVSVVHGDFRFDNVMFDHGLHRITAIFDWELCAVGDPLADLGLLLAYWAADDGLTDLLAHKRLTAALGLSGRDVADRYAIATGSPLDALDFYTALGYFKWAVIREGVYRRQLDGAMPDENSAAIGASVAPIAGRGLELAVAAGLRDPG